MPDKRVAGIRLCFLLLYSGAAFLLFYNLSDRLLWSDEAETALLGKSIVKFGVPVVYDGKNIISHYPDLLESNDDRIWTWNTWLPYYLAAVSFRILGTTTFAARLPFVILAFLAVILMRPAARAYCENEGTALISTLLLVTSVPFLLHARQCRYYSILALGTLWMIIGYHQMALQEKPRGGIHVALALIVLFYSSFISFVGSFLAIGIHSLVLIKRKPNLLRSIIPCYIATVLAVLPWVLYAGMLGKGGQDKTANCFYTLADYLVRINFHIFPLALLFIPAISMVWKKLPLRNWVPSKKTSVLLLAVTCQLLCLSVFPFVYFRYLVTIMPVIFILEAYILHEYVSSRILRYALIAALVATNIIGIISLYPLHGAYRFGSPIFSFVRGITTPYEDTMENIVDFLSENATENETLAVPEPGYELIFYTNMKVVNSVFKKNREEALRADWILTEVPAPVIPWYRPRTRLQPFDSTRPPPYKIYTLQVRDTPPGASRPDPDYYQNLQVEQFREFVIYRLLKSEDNGA